MVRIARVNPVISNKMVSCIHQPPLVYLKSTPTAGSDREPVSVELTDE